MARAIVLTQNQYIHVHLLHYDHDQTASMEATSGAPGNRRAGQPKVVAAPARWAIIHGFLAGFSFGGFSLFVNTIAAPAMPSPWLGFVPGLLFGLGTMIVLAFIGAMFGASLRRTRLLTEEEMKRIGAQTGGRTLFFGGLLFGLFGIATIRGVDRYMPVDVGYVPIGLFMPIIAVPALIFSWRAVTAARKNPGE